MNVDNFNVAMLILSILLFLSIGIIFCLCRLVKNQKEQIKSLNEKNKEVESICHDLTVVANFDPLTGLPNRRAFEEAFDHQICLLPLGMGENRHVSVPGGMELLFIDIDYFKSINDNYGHSVGDEVLQTLAKTIKSVLRENDLVCRWGGEEIVVALTNINQEHVGIVPEKIRAKIEGFKFSEANLAVTVSIGVTYAKYRCGLDALIEEADTAMYQAKNDGRNKVQIYESSDLL